MKNILLGIVRICSSLLKCNYLQKQKVFLNFSFHLWYIHQILNIFEEKMIMIANLFPRLQTVKSFVKALSKNCRFRTSFEDQHVKWSQTLVKSEWEIFYHIFWSLWEEMTWEISPLLNFEILEVFVNTLTADEQYPLRDCKKLKFLIQMELSLKKNFLSIFGSVYGIFITLETFSKKTWPW